MLYLGYFPLQLYFIIKCAFLSIYIILINCTLVVEFTPPCWTGRAWALHTRTEQSSCTDNSQLQVIGKLHPTQCCVRPSGLTLATRIKGLKYQTSEGPVKPGKQWPSKWQVSKTAVESTHKVSILAVQVRS